ncbi:hypothetical protein SDJN02_12361, partial [Cucurbita argyrosperma subsp. argyrosperma]
MAVAIERASALDERILRRNCVTEQNRKRTLIVDVVTLKLKLELWMDGWMDGWMGVLVDRWMRSFEV